MNIVSFARVLRAGVWFGVVRSAPLLAVVTCFVLSFEASAGARPMVLSPGNTLEQRICNGYKPASATPSHDHRCSTHASASLYVLLI